MRIYIHCAMCYNITIVKGTTGEHLKPERVRQDARAGTDKKDC